MGVGLSPINNITLFAHIINLPSGNSGVDFCQYLLTTAPFSTGSPLDPCGLTCDVVGDTKPSKNFSKVEAVSLTSGTTYFPLSGNCLRISSKDNHSPTTIESQSSNSVPLPIGTTENGDNAFIETFPVLNCSTPIILVLVSITGLPN